MRGSYGEAGPSQGCGTCYKWGCDPSSRVYNASMSAQKYANFPERELKVSIGAHISATTSRLLSKLSIGTYEMTVGQQEKVAGSAEQGRYAINNLARELQLSATSKESRDYLCDYTAEGNGHKFQLWISTPFESGQTNHLVWAKYTDTTSARKIGVAFRLATSFNSEEIFNLLKQSQKNAVDLKEDEAYPLKGNPPPRFTKKAPAADAAAKPAEGEAAAAPVEGTPPAAE